MGGFVFATALLVWTGESLTKLDFSAWQQKEDCVRAEAAHRLSHIVPESPCEKMTRARAQKTADWIASLKTQGKKLEWKP